MKITKFFLPLLVLAAAIAKWNGQLPTYSGNGAILFTPVK